jgi:hypothetical protein
MEQGMNKIETGQMAELLAENLKLWKRNTELEDLFKAMKKPKKKLSQKIKDKLKG